jgi:hypothetical protein
VVEDPVVKVLLVDGAVVAGDDVCVVEEDGGTEPFVGDVVVVVCFWPVPTVVREDTG